MWVVKLLVYFIEIIEKIKIYIFFEFFFIELIE